MNPAHLFHVCEDPDIKVFQPRPPASGDLGTKDSVVWAVSHTHLPGYIAPPDCPRVSYGRGPATTAADAETFLDGVSGRVVVVELGWLNRMRSASLFVYAFEPEANWRPLGNGGGRFISREPVTPIDCIRVDNASSVLLALGSDLRSRVNLWGLIDQISASSLDYAFLQQQNAAPRREL
jgi:hypothetical protein